MPAFSQKKFQGWTSMFKFYCTYITGDKMPHPICFIAFYTKDKTFPMLSDFGLAFAIDRKLYQGHLLLFFINKCIILINPEYPRNNYFHFIYKLYILEIYNIKKR